MREEKGKKGKVVCQMVDMGCLCTETFGIFQLFTSLSKADVFWWRDAGTGLRRPMCLVNAWGEQGKLLAFTTLQVHDWESPLQIKIGAETTSQYVAAYRLTGMLQ